MWKKDYLYYHFYCLYHLLVVALIICGLIRIFHQLEKLMKLLFINACIRGDKSRTLQLAKYFLSNYKNQYKDVEIEEIDLNKENIHPILSKELENRDRLIKNKEYDNEIFKYARQFSLADKIVIASPCWDYSFPSILKVYIENVCVLGMTFRYNTEGSQSTGLSKFSSLLYVTTVGGYPHDKEYMNNISAFLGNGKYFEVCATGLDIVGNDVNKILEEAKTKLDKISNKF